MAKTAFWESWRNLQAEILQARAEGCVRPAHLEASSRCWEEASNMALRLPAPWEEAQAIVDEGRRYLRYR